MNGKTGKVGIESMMRTGTPEPLGAHWDGSGVNFVLPSAAATAVELCLFDAGTGRETLRCALPGRSGERWHGWLPGAVAGPGTLYGYRVHGAFAPKQGLRFNPGKLLIDPSARELAGELRYDASVMDDPVEGPLVVDSAPFVPKGRVVDRNFDWGDVLAPAVPWRDSIIYELHVRNFTRNHPQVPAAWRGRYLGLTVPAVIAHLRSLGITAVELMPCQEFASERFLLERGLVNHWGYNPIAFSAPAQRYAVSDPVAEFKSMVKALHQAGIEVILDLVFNHTAEAGADGVTLSLKGIDNAGSYRLRAGDATRYEDFTGCGNTLAAGRPAVLELILDSLRWWAGEMRVDGFRLDLATALARDAGGFNPHAQLFAAIRSDPLLAYCKWIAEPWDLGPDGYRLGGFPTAWAEWNDRYRDTVRRFWRGDSGTVAELAERLAGSSDLFRAGGRSPQSSLNFVTAHDGFTLADLVSYEQRHNEANLEGNRDGHVNNYSCNCGVEGITDDPQVRRRRRNRMRSLLATLLLSQGTPMLLSGDEFAHSQRGNNNAYCQDNELSWIDWPPADQPAEASLVPWIARLTEFRRRRPELRRNRFFKGASRDRGQADVRWLHPTGRDMSDADWEATEGSCLGMLLGSESQQEGELLLLLSAEDHAIDFQLPVGLQGRWIQRFDSAGEDTADRTLEIRDHVRLVAHSLQLLERLP